MRKLINIVMGLLMALGSWVLLACLMPMQVPADFRLDVRHGQNLYGVTRRLGDAGILQQPWGLIIYEHLFARHARIYAGIYPLPHDLNGWELLAMLTDEPGRYVQRLTVVEGTTLKDLLKQLTSLGMLASDEAGIMDSWRQDLGIKQTSLEGWLAPDTYGFEPGMPTRDLIRSMLNRQQAILQREWENRASDLPYHDAYDALIMASIIEKETGQADEREHIAGVFINRLRMNMRLQTDPTVIYGMGDSYHGHLSKADLETWTPYNTYRIQGLPPTPIAFPGRAAVHAALHPLLTHDIYFVAKGDGTHAFSSNLKEQNQAVDTYQRHRREGYRATP
ncbi:MAG: endolytic transglycosylase MltG [Pseudomonadales bacterium]|nr:endolytic transglycosylase MltG [Pseudomonadales bacterium]